MARGQSDGEIATEHANLQQRVRAALAAAAENDATALAGLLDEGDALIKYEEQIPRLRVAHQRGRALRIVYAAAAVSAANQLALICLVFAGTIYWAWMVLLLPALIATIVVTTTAHDMPTSRRFVPWAGAIPLLGVAVSADLAATHVLTWGYAVIATLLALFAGGAWSNGSIGRWLSA